MTRSECTYFSHCNEWFATDDCGTIRIFFNGRNFSGIRGGGGGGGEDFSFSDY